MNEYSAEDMLATIFDDFVLITTGAESQDRLSSLSRTPSPASSENTRAAFGES